MVDRIAQYHMFGWNEPESDDQYKDQMMEPEDLVWVAANEGLIARPHDTQDNPLCDMSVWRFEAYDGYQYLECGYFPEWDEADDSLEEGPDEIRLSLRWCLDTESMTILEYDGPEVRV